MAATHEAALLKAEELIGTAIASIDLLLGANVKKGDKDRILTDAMRNVRARVSASPHLPFDPLSVLSGATLGQVEGEVKQIKLAANGPFNITAAPRGGKDAHPIHDGRYEGKNFIRALQGERTSNERSSGSSARFSEAGMPGSYTTANLPPGLRAQIDPASGINAASVADAANWLQRMGVTPGPYAGYFAGSSQTARETLAGYIRNGEKIDSSKIKGTNDVTAVIGALKAKGKDENDPALPEDLRAIYKRMKKDGVDLDDPKAIRKYSNDHREELEAIRKDTQKTMTAPRVNAGQTLEQNDAERQRLRDAGPQSAPATSPPKAPQAPTQAAPDKAKPTPKPKVKELDLLG